MPARLLGGFAAAVVGRRRLVAAVLVVVTVALAAGVLRLEFETSQETLVDPSSQVGEENRHYQATFGGEAMLVAWTGDVDALTEAGNLERLAAMEDQLRAADGVEAVLGPVTALRFAEEQLGVAPGLLTRAGRGDLLTTEIGRLGAAGEASLQNPEFVQFLLRDADGEIRQALRDNFPDEQHVLMIVRLAGNADIATQGAAAEHVQGVVDARPLEGFQSVAAGVPTLLDEINDYLQGGMASLGALAVAAMVLLLALVFRARWRLLSLLAVVVGCVWSFGAAGHLGIPLTLVTISGLPILLGLGVDFAIQLHSRFEEEIHAGHDAATATRRTLERMGRPLLVAMVAAVAGLLALELSPVPMIRDFGLLLAIGMVGLVAAALTIVPFALAGRELRTPTDIPRHERSGGRLESLVLRLMTMLRRGALATGAVAVVVAGLGLWAEGRTEIETDPEKWISPESQAVRDLEGLRDATGFSSEVDVLVEADDVTAPEVIAWMQRYTAELLERRGDALLRATSMPEFVSKVTGEPATPEDVHDLLSVAPDDVARSFVSADRLAANIVFPVAPISLAERQELLEEMERIAPPPEGITATPAGLAVVGIELVDGLDAGRRTITLLSLGLVFVWLLLAYRNLRLAVLPLLPVLLAVGLSMLAVHLMGISLTPLTTVASPLAIAISTEFSVLVMARYLEERADGRAPEEAIGVGGARIGRAFLASGLTVLGGFAVLIAAPLPLLVDFGVVVSVIVLVALVSCLVVMPAVLVRSDPAR